MDTSTSDRINTSILPGSHKFHTMYTANIKSTCDKCSDHYQLHQVHNPSSTRSFNTVNKHQHIFISEVHNHHSQVGTRPHYANINNRLKATQNA
eukprot:7584919-Ditylum_brightwellii.AAC.1